MLGLYISIVSMSATAKKAFSSQAVRVITAWLCASLRNLSMCLFKPIYIRNACAFFNETRRNYSIQVHMSRMTSSRSRGQRSRSQKRLSAEAYRSTVTRIMRAVKRGCKNLGFLGF